MMDNMDNLWRDEHLYKIPILMPVVLDEDYLAIMSSFHYLLLKRDKETYREIVKYWAILIITAPNAFERDELYSGQVFDAVQDEAISTNLPREKLYLPPGWHELELADKLLRFLRSCKPKYSSMNMNDGVVYRWYNDPENIMAARAFFGIYCMNLLRAFTQSPSSVIEECNYIFNCYDLFSFGDKPDRNISFGHDSAIFIRNAFRSEDATYRKVIRMVLDWYYFNYKKHSGWRTYDNTRSFFDYAVRLPLSHFGLDAVRSMVDLSTHKNLVWPAVERAKREELTLTVKRVARLLYFVSKVNSQDESFLQDNKQFKNQRCKLWPYSRLISPDYFSWLADEENPEFVAFCVGLNRKDRSSELDSISCLRKLTNRMEYYQLAHKLYPEVYQFSKTGTNDLKLGIPEIFYTKSHDISEFIRPK